MAEMKSRDRRPKKIASAYGAAMPDISGLPGAMKSA
jgi:hypothetical protein